MARPAKAFSRLLVITLCLSIMPELLWAQDTAGVKEELLLLKEESVSIAARHEQPISEAPSNVYVITDEDIRQSGATDIPTVLRRVPGIEVMQMTGADINVSVRGDNQPRANKLLVLLDGRSIYLDIQGEVRWKEIPVTLPEIKRIEVLKGPASALYGFNAFDGVINIITKSPEEMKGTTVQFGGGEFGTITAAAIEAGNIGKFGYRLSAGRDQNNQWKDRNALAFRDHKVNIQTEYALSSVSKLNLTGGFVDVNRFQGPDVDVINTQNTSRQGYINAGYERPNFFVRGYWTEFHQPATIGINPREVRFFQTTNRDGTNSLIQDWDSYNVESQHALDFGSTNRFTYGVNYRNNAFSSNFINQFTREERLGLYLQDEWRATDKITAILGFRYDLHTEIHPTYSPRAALVYKPDANHSFRVGGSVAYRPPTVFETHTDSRGIVFPLGCPPTCAVRVNTVLRGSDSLSPEQMISYEAGYQGWFLKHRLRTRLDVFYNHLSDLIVQQRQTATLNTFANGKESDIYGGEASMEFLATSWLSGFANYAFQDINSVAHNITQFDLRAGPRQKVNVGLRAELENGLNGEAWLNYVGAATYPINSIFFSFTGGVPPPNPRVGSYVLLNLRAAYRFWQEKAEVAVTVFNALNDQHREHPLEETIGSRVMGWLTIRL